MFKMSSNVGPTTNNFGAKNLFLSHIFDTLVDLLGRSTKVSIDERYTQEEEQEQYGQHLVLCDPQRGYCVYAYRLNLITLLLSDPRCSLKSLDNSKTIKILLTAMDAGNIQVVEFFHRSTFVIDSNGL